MLLKIYFYAYTLIICYLTYRVILIQTYMVVLLTKQYMSSVKQYYYTTKCYLT